MGGWEAALLSGDKNIVPLDVAILAAFLFYRYKLVSRAKELIPLTNGCS
ncbi:hypothetical protein SAMN05428961_10280 [Paenibacillus sp. OK060]|nr:hypothetical protein SAMN05428961_10280 [Paenibacillus sp. OK060]